MNIVMPKMGESVNEGTIIKWHKSVGDNVKRDEIIFEISTDKVDTEIPSPASGKLAEIKVPEGDTVEVGTVVALLDINGEVLPESTTDADKEEKKESIPTSEIQSETSTQEPDVKSSKLLEIEMPKMGESVMEGTIIKWFKKVGDPIKKDETLFEISTDKVDTEVPSPVEGTIAEILVGEQETVDVGTIVAKISTGKGMVIERSDTKSEIQETLSAQPASMHDNFSAPEIDYRDKLKKDDRFYSPLVLSIAQKENVSFPELERINGSGLNNRVTKKDILSYIEKRKTVGFQPAQTEPPETSATIDVPKGFVEMQPSGEVEKIPMDNIRQKIMEHMVASRDTSVHVTSLIEADMMKIEKFLQENREEYWKREGVKLTYMAFIADACIKALKKYPLINSSIEGNTIIQKKYINLGIAVALEPNGLIVPNVKAADHRNIIGLANAIHDLASRARNKKLSPDDITGGTFTITNFGVFGTVFGVPIINQPEVAILGVGAVIKKPVVIDVDGSDAIAVRPIMSLTLSHDHRLIDGMLGSLFLKYVKETLEGFDQGSL